MSAGTVTLTETEVGTPGRGPVAHIFNGSEGEMARVLGRRVKAYCGVWVTPPQRIGVVEVTKPHHCPACASIFRARRSS